MIIRCIFLCLFFTLVLSNSVVWARDSDKGSLDDLIEDIEEEEKEDDEDVETPDDKNNKDDGTGCMGEFAGECLAGCIRELGPLFFQFFIEYMAHIRFADYPYAGSSDFDFSTIYSEDPPANGQIGFLKISSETAYLMDSMIGIIGRLEGNLSLLHINLYYQYLYESPSWFSIFSINGGLSLTIFNFMMSFYCGMFKFDYQDNTIDDVLFSYGASMQIFFYHNISLDIFNINAQYHSLGFHTLSASLNYSISLFTFGIGYNLNLFGYNYEEDAGQIFQGPVAKVTIWL